MSFSPILGLTSEFPGYVQENVSLHKPYFDFLKDNENQYNFFQWCLRNYQYADLELTKEDFTLILQHTDYQHLDLEGHNSLGLALMYGKAQTVPLTAEHFATILQGSGFVVKSDPLLDDSLGLMPLFVMSSMTVFTPTSEEISTILENIAQKNKIEESLPIAHWNALHYALYYGKIGQAPLEEKHFDYLFENFEYNLSQLFLGEDTENTILNNKAKYDTLKEKKLMDLALEKNDKTLSKPIKI